MLPNPAQRLDGLSVCADHVLDPVNRNILANGFPYNFQPQVSSILARIKGKSHAYGHIRSNRVVFLIDISGSMGTEFRTDCGEDYNRLEFVVHDLHKILHHRVSKDFMFNVITFASEARKWNSRLTPATKSHLKKVEHHLDHLEASGGTNTHDALKMAILEEQDADTIYVLSDGEPTHGITNTKDILNDVKLWISRRKTPVTINTIAFLMGHTYDDPKPRQFMAQLASLTPDGVFRCADPFAKDEEYVRDGLTSSSTFDQDKDFISFFEQRMNQMPKFNSIPNQPNSFSSIMPSPISQQVSPQPIPFGIQQQPIDYRAILKQRVRSANDIKISKAQDVRGHTLYTIDIQIDTQYFKPICWAVSHPFAEFEKLHSRMKNQIVQKNLTNSLKLPPHTAFHHSDPRSIEQRRSQLEVYIKSMYHYFNPEEFPDVDIFLLYDLNISQAISIQQINDRASSNNFQGQFPPLSLNSSQQYIPPSPNMNQQYIPPSPNMNQQYISPIPNMNQQYIPPILNSSQQYIPPSPNMNRPNIPPSPNMNQPNIPPSPNMNRPNIPPSPNMNQPNIPPSPNMNQQYVPPNLNSSQQYIPPNLNSSQPNIPPSPNMNQQYIPYDTQPNVSINSSQSTLYSPPIDQSLAFQYNQQPTAPPV